MQDNDTSVLEGGWGQDEAPIKIGNTVHRQVSDNGDYVHAILKFLEEKEYSWAPHFLGIDGEGREIVDFIEGYVPHGQEVPPETWSLSTMSEIFEHIRQLHELTAGSELAQGQECVCHGDLSFANTTYREGKAVAFIDWDWTHPGRRIDDVAYALLQYLSIGEYMSPKGPGEQAELARKLVDAYGLASEQRSLLVDTMLGSLLATREKQMESIRRNTPAAQRLAKAGVPELMLKRHKWLEDNKGFFIEAFK